jgi:hypothetical protein
VAGHVGDWLSFCFIDGVIIYNKGNSHADARRWLSHLRDCPFCNGDLLTHGTVVQVTNILWGVGLYCDAMISSVWLLRQTSTAAMTPTLFYFKYKLSFIMLCGSP